MRAVSVSETVGACTAVAFRVFVLRGLVLASASYFSLGLEIVFQRQLR